MTEQVLARLRGMTGAIRGYVLFLLLYLLLGLLGVFEVRQVLPLLCILLTVLPVGGASEHDAGAAAGRYLLVLLAALIAGCLGLLLVVFLSIGGRLPLEMGVGLLCLSLGGGVVLAGLLLPVQYRLGKAGARPYVYLLPCLVLLSVLWYSTAERTIPTYLGIVFLLTALLSLLPSLLLSCRFAQER